MAAMLKKGDTTGLKAFLLLADGAQDHGASRRDATIGVIRRHLYVSKGPLEKRFHREAATPCAGGGSISGAERRPDGPGARRKLSRASGAQARSLRRCAGARPVGAP